MFLFANSVANLHKNFEKGEVIQWKGAEGAKCLFFMRRRMIVQKKAICDNISSGKFAKNWQFDSKFLYLHI